MELKKKIANILLEKVGGKPKIYNYYNDYYNIDVFTTINSKENFKTIATIGLSEYIIGKNLSNGLSLRVEFIACSDLRYIYFENILSDCAFNIISGEYYCDYGAIYPNIIDKYYPNENMKHIFLVSPFLWELKGRVIDGVHVEWLMAIPISEDEYQYARKNGVEALENLLEKYEADFLNLNRNSVLK